ncbi:hypothetical protein ZOSMA_183G00140 [Zostera marina]|uniref:Uncharacterized protein n=1 Tax=Zostera marina TaxID=29655 RepID=A0A0K9PQD5_ZOSMR|nr:hypothetical protein ZOSMA_183G00140 [Zostera marina]
MENVQPSEMMQQPNTLFHSSGDRYHFGNGCVSCSWPCISLEQMVDIILDEGPSNSPSCELVCLLNDNEVEAGWEESGMEQRKGGVLTHFEPKLQGGMTR